MVLSLCALLSNDAKCLKDEVWLPRLRCHVVLSRTHLEAVAATGSLAAARSDKLKVCVVFV